MTSGLPKRVLVDLLTILACGVPTGATTQAAVDDGTAPYVDRLIDHGAMPALPVESDDDGVDRAGHARSLSVEANFSQISPSSWTDPSQGYRSDNPEHEAGLSLSGRYETDNYGVLGIAAGLRRGTAVSSLIGNVRPNRVRGSVTLTDRDLPLGDGWIADTGLGVVTTTMIPIARNQARFYLPSSPLLGGTIIFRGYQPLAQNGATGPKATINLSIGEPGVLNGLRLTDYSPLLGLEVTGGGQVHVAPRFQLGVQAINMVDTIDPYAVKSVATGSADETYYRTSGRAALFSGSFTGPRFQLQGNMLWSDFGVRDNGQNTDPVTAADPSSSGGPGLGVWLDGSYRSGRTSHSAGIYYLDPSLHWGTAPILNDAYGLYYRFATSNQRWRWLASIDAAKSISGEGQSGVIANGDVRRQIGLRTAIGIDTSIRAAGGTTATRILAYTEFDSGLGTSRGEVGWGREYGAATYHLGFTQNWTLPAWTPVDSRLSTELSYDHRRQWPDATDAAIGTTHLNGIGIAVSAAAAPYPGISIDATIAYNSDSNNGLGGFSGMVGGSTASDFAIQRGQALSASLSATARLSPHWTLSGTFTDSRSSLRSRYGITQLVSSPLGLTPAQMIEEQRSAFRLVAGYLTLRYSISAGHPASTLGRRQFAGGGSGDIRGRVFFDANADNHRDPSEAGAAGITIILDGILATRTDAAGYYHFDTVAEGRHRITVSADTLPLPWFIVGSAATDGLQSDSADYTQDVQIDIRSVTNLDVAAHR